MDLHRPKIAAIYNTTYDWFNNVGAIQYVAHAITNANTAILLRGAIQIGAGGGPSEHPDQQYWLNHNFSVAIATAGGLGQIRRIEIDCTLTPCAGQFNGCLYRVPQLVAAAGFTGKPLRIFSHRNEGMGRVGSPTTKRYIECMSNGNQLSMTQAMNAHEGWSWAPWAGVYA
ncbi:MAG: hypothetical protein EOO52_11220 [Gammaproteobacteria bacterium]|nr:MAG: hypothetical protein EOO52_11220 [Gammaproteobacteria bacterium]